MFINHHLNKISERFQKKPVSYYGHTKLWAEELYYKKI